MNDTFPEEMPAVKPNGRPRIGPTLANVVTRSRALPDRIVLYAEEKWGKTSFAAHLPDVIFLTIKGEDGLQKLIQSGRLPETPHFEEPAANWNDVTHAVSELTVSDHPYRTLVIDTANAAERLAQEEICQDEHGGDWGEHGFGGFGRGEKTTANRLWQPFLGLLDRLREAKQMRIVLVCHTVIRTFQNPEGPNYDRIEPALSKQGWGMTSKWCDMILYGATLIETEAIRKEKGKVTKARATGGKVRVLHTERSATFSAGNRHGLAPLIKLPDGPEKAFAAFRAAFPRRPQPQPKAEPKPAAPETPKETNGQPQQDSADRPANARPGD